MGNKDVIEVVGVGNFRLNLGLLVRLKLPSFQIVGENERSILFF